MATNVIDELVVKLKLDTKDYDKRTKQLDRTVDATGKKADRTTANIKRMALGIKDLARNIATLMGVGSVGGVVGMLSALTTMETGLRRAAVSTGLSNRELKAWSSTARRLGADAQSGAQAIADLAREQKQFNVTGQGPTMQALARMGVRVGPGVNLVDALAHAQQIFRAAPAGQQGQLESTLAAQGVSADLILMIKDERNIRETYARSYAESAESNREAMAALDDAFESLKNGARNLAMVLATALQPHVEKFAAWLRAISADETRVKQVADGLATAMKALADVVTLTFEGFNKLSGWLDLLQVTTRSGARLAPEQLARVRTPAERAALAAMDADFRRPGGGAAPRAAGNLGTASGMMGYLIAQHGLSVDQAAAMVANFQAESRLDPAAFNPEGGGQGAFGIGQWRGPRLAALRARFGANPTLQQQLDFAMTDAEEQRRMRQAFGAGGNIGTNVSRLYEAHGMAREDARRGVEAARLAREYSIGQQVNVQNLNVQANNPQQLGQQLNRISGTQNYAAGVR